MLDRRARPIPELEVLATGQLGREAQLDRWLNDGSTYTDAEGRFEWLTRRGQAPQLWLAPVPPQPRILHTLSADENVIRLAQLAMVHCLLREPSGQAGAFRGFGYEVWPRDGEPYGSFSTTGQPDPSGLAVFMWPVDALRVRVSSPGFEPVEIPAPDQPCLLRRR